MEPLHKELMPGITATLSEDGTLILMEEQVTLDQFDKEDGGVKVTTIQLPAAACRALLKFLTRQASRDRIHYYKGQRNERKQ